MIDKYNILNLSLEKEYINIIWQDNHESKFHFLWLRDNCPTSFHLDSKMRKFNILSVSKDIYPKKINNTKIYNLDEEALFMEFEDKILNG